MTYQTHLYFNIAIGSQKPDSIRNQDTRCPFCDRQQLTGIIDEKGPIMLLKNKYPVLEETFQTVLIETDRCDSDLSLYPKEHLYTLLDFAVTHWQRMIRSGEYRSVLLFKNHGPHSGGTIAHPHMQIVGLRHLDDRKHVTGDHFKGILIERDNGVEFNLSTLPRMGFYEYNVILNDRMKLYRMADYIQIAVKSIVSGEIHPRCNSYNMFFYQMNDRIIAKIIPRYITSPLFVGYSIPQVGDNLPEKVKEIQERYL